MPYKKGMEALLKQEKGMAAVLVPGGALEALNSDKDQIRLVLNRRKGFIKLALRYSVDIRYIQAWLYIKRHF